MSNLIDWYGPSPPSFTAVGPAAEDAMGIESIIEPSSLSMLARVLESHCGKHGILLQEARDSVAVSVIEFYQCGYHREEDLLNMLEEQDRPQSSRHGRIQVKAIPFQE
jgi:hypothetical protein